MQREKLKRGPKPKKPRVTAFHRVSMYGTEWMICGNGRKLTGRECRDAVVALNAYFDGVDYGRSFR